MGPLCLPGLLFVETISQSSGTSGLLWSSTLKIIGRQNALKSSEKATPEEAEASVFEEAVAYIKFELADWIHLNHTHFRAPYIFPDQKISEFEPEYPPPMPDHLDWLGMD